MKFLKIVWSSIPFVALAVVVVAVAQCFHAVLRPPEIGEDVDHVDWLPQEATNIYYYRSYGFTAYEFKICESGFLKWASTAAPKPSSDYATYVPVTDVAELDTTRNQIIDRYNFMLERDTYEAKGLNYSDFLKRTTITIENGLFGAKRHASAGGYSIGYDRNTGTAYWQSNPR